MPTVNFTANLKRFYPDLQTMEVEATTVAEVLQVVEEQHRGLRDYVVDEQGRLRKHVNIFIGKEMVRDRHTLADPLKPTDEIFIMQALSGG